MEDGIQDLIQDVNYVEENMEDGLRPTEKIKLPSRKEVEAYAERVAKKDPHYFAFENITSQPLGLYCFSKYVATDQFSTKQMGFLEELVQWRQKNKGSEGSTAYAAGLYNKWLLPSSESPMVGGGIFGNGGGESPTKIGKYKYKEDWGTDDVTCSVLYRSTVYRGYQLPPPHEEVFDPTPEILTQADARLDEPVEIPDTNEDEDGEQSVRLSDANAKDERSSSAKHSSGNVDRRISLHSIRTKSVRRRRGSWVQGALPSRGDDGLASAITPVLEETTSEVNDFDADEKSLLARPEVDNAVGYAEPPDLAVMRSTITSEAERLVGTKSSASADADDADEDIEPAFGLAKDLFDGPAKYCLEQLEAKTKSFMGTKEWFMFVQALLIRHNYENTMDKFIGFRVLGKGGFGEVYAVKKKDTGVTFACKFMSKTLVEEKKAVQLCWNERDCLSVVHSPFIVSVKYAFQDPKSLALVMDLQTGGDLHFHLGQVGRFDLKIARFFAAEICLGLEHLHTLGFVYRDLKPENVLLDKYGHCKLSDLGLAVEYSPDLCGYAGTIGYMSPDMYAKTPEGKYDPKSKNWKPYGYSTDLWSYGVLLYEFLVGEIPFKRSSIVQWANSSPGAKGALEKLAKKGGDKEPSKRAKIRAIVPFAVCEMDIEYDTNIIPKRGVRLLKGLLNRDRKARYDWSRVKSSTFFSKSLDWGAINQGKLEPPFVPPQNKTQAKDASDINALDDNDVTALDKESDQKWSEWNMISDAHFQHEMVEFFQWRDKQSETRPDAETGKDRRKSKTCSIS